MKDEDINTIKYQLDDTIFQFERLIDTGVWDEAPSHKESILKNIDYIKSGKNTYLKGNEDYFSLPITIGIKNDYYRMTWDIKRLKEFLKNKVKEVKVISLKEIHWEENEISQSKLDALKVKFPNRNYDYPIIYVNHPIIRIKIVIDGTHRCKLNSNSNIPNIQAIELTFDEMYNLLYSEFHKHLFNFHANFILLRNFL